ncbi:uncharacterized protein [Diabrotica undecimpunctata]|uniref:uncharacterized protein n=1 Tax=Diabrotica undecimpunctata TaxID=50387 RepID=UPI003B6345E2
MVLAFVKSQKGNNLLLYNGFLHKKERVVGEKTIWKCATYNKCKCTGRVHTVVDEITKSTEHNHVADTAKIEAKEACNRMKEVAQQLEHSTQGVVSEISQGLSLAATAQLPSVSSLKKTVQRVRNELEGTPANPRNLEELVLPEEYKTTTGGELFLLFDSGPEEERILLFSTQRYLRFMEQCDHWYADGTFNSAPPLFSQIYTIHGVRYSNVIPTVFALLTNKTQETYTRVFQQLKVLNPALRPLTIMMDFERAAMNAAQTEFPNVRIRGCFFHFSQCMWRHIQSAGLQRRYIENPDFALHLRQLTALAFVPDNHVVRVYEELLNSDFYTQNEELLVPLINYFEDTWVGRLARRGNRRQPLFPANVWNCYDLADQDIPRTNNAVEGWHNSFSSLLNKQYISGNVPPRKRKYQDTANRIRTIVADYADRPTLEYLRGIAHNFQLQT